MRTKFFFCLAFLFFLWIPSTAHASDNIFGFQDDSEKTVIHFPLMTDIGVKWVRTFVFWSEVEPTREDSPKYHWKKYDEKFRRLTEMGLTPIVIIAGNPSWMSTHPGGPFDKGDVKDYLRFVQALVKRYDGDGKEDAPGSPKILYWEIYNEPDLVFMEYARYNTWGFWGNEPVKYANLLKAVYPVIKGACPDAQVVFGGIALDNWAHFNSKFFEDVLKSGGGPFFDIMNFHYYLPFHRVWDRFGPDIIGKVNYIKNQLTSHGLKKEIFCTEAGHWSAEESSLEFQASYLVKLFARAMAADLKSVIWYVLVDQDTKGTDFTRGLVDTKLNKKPAYYALRHLVTYLKGAIYRQPLVPSQEGGDIQFELDWMERIQTKISPHSIAEGYVFYRVDLKKDIYVLWSNSKECKINILGKSIKIYDRYGKMKELKTSNGNPISFKLTPEPVFIEKER
jgi:hypothetical protein